MFSIRKTENVRGRRHTKEKCEKFQRGFHKSYHRGSKKKVSFKRFKKNYADERREKEIFPDSGWNMEDYIDRTLSLWNAFLRLNLYDFTEIVRKTDRNTLHAFSKEIIYFDNIGHLTKIVYLKIILKEIHYFNRDILEEYMYSTNFELIEFAKNNGADVSFLFGFIVSGDHLRHIRRLGGSVFSKVFRIKQVRNGWSQPHWSIRPGKEMSMSDISELGLELCQELSHNYLTLLNNEDIITFVNEEYGVIKIQKCFRKYMAGKKANLMRSDPDMLFDEVHGERRRKIMEIQHTWETMDN